MLILFLGKNLCFNGVLVCKLIIFLIFLLIYFGVWLMIVDVIFVFKLIMLFFFFLSFNKFLKDLFNDKEFFIVFFKKVLFFVYFE